ncbi:MAG: hypothetical protein JNK16_15785 [Phycisphaerales bacterium]|nr:hypothetical protein [Phycisphaerales bacterium]
MNKLSNTLLWFAAFFMAILLLGASCTVAQAQREPGASPPAPAQRREPGTLPLVAPPPLREDPSELLWQSREEQRWAKILEELFWRSYKNVDNRWTQKLQDEATWLGARSSYVEVVYLEDIEKYKAEGTLAAKMKEARDELTQIRERRIRFTQDVMQDVFHHEPGVRILELFDLPAPKTGEANQPGSK